MKKRRWLLGLPIDLLDMESAIAACLTRAGDTTGEPCRVVTINPEMIVRARRDRGLRESILRADLVVPDGVGIVLAGRLRGWRNCARVPGIELCERLVAAAAGLGWPVFFYGGEPGAAEAAAETLRSRYPGLRIAGTSHGYLDPRDEAALPARVRASGARLLLVGTGLPHQELWLQSNLPATGARFGMGVGGSLDVFSGRIPRAPGILRRLGLEWAYRLYREPRRWRRMLVLPVFLLLVLMPRKARRIDDGIRSPG